jgi:hypothetical protein
MAVYFTFEGINELKEDLEHVVTVIKPSSLV